MKIKSITPTNKFAEIEFSEIINDPVGKFVYTPSGFQPVLKCEHIKRGETLKITTDSGELICDPMHRLRVYREHSQIPIELFACELNPKTDKLEGYDNTKLDFVILPHLVSDLYDIQLPDPHWWYTSGVVSHNSILLCNNALASLKYVDKNGNPAGNDVLLITFELDTIKTAMRCLAAAVGIPLAQITERRSCAERVAGQIWTTHQKSLVIHELPPDECSVNHIYALLDNLKRERGWKPGVVILDYMDLMVSRNPAYNKDDYIRQKHVASEIRGLAKNEEVLVFTATQTNRSGAKGDELVDLTKAAESFGKQFSLDYIISLNQTEQERLNVPPTIRFLVAKNRNGPKLQVVTCDINYDTMVVKENS